MENLEYKNDNLNNEDRKEFPTQINIEGYLYTKKDAYKKAVCYRCSNRSTYQLTITIDFEEFKKINGKKNDEKIKYNINSRQKEYICIKKELKEVEVKKVMAINEIKALAEKLIRINIDKDNNFLIDNFNQNGIKWNNRKILNLVHKIKQEKYPNNDKFINSILNTTISYNDVNYNFVPVKYEYHDNKTNKIEKIIIITSNFN